MNKYQKAFENIKNECAKYHNFDIVDDFETLKELVDKATPKKVKNMNDQLNFKTGDFEYRSGECPVCGKENGCNEFNENEYCRGCGQKLDWSENDE